MIPPVYYKLGVDLIKDTAALTYICLNVNLI